MFKVGDWVRSTKYLHMAPCKVESIFESNERKGDFGLKSRGTVHYASEAELWLPKEGEWVICGLSNTDDAFWVIKYNEHEVISLSEYNPHEDVIIQPFIGELPSFLKENR